MHVVFALAVLATLALAETMPEQFLAHATARLVLALGGISVAVGLTAVVTLGTVRALRCDFHGRDQWLRGFRHWQTAQIGVWLCVVAGIQLGLRWPQLVQMNWHLRDAVLVDELLILAPLVVPLILSWAVEFEVSRAVRAGGKWEPWRLRARARRQFVAVQVRHYLALVLIPVLALFFTRDVVQRWWPIMLSGRLAWLVYAVPIMAIVVFFPAVLRTVWRTEPLAEGPLRRRLERCAQRCAIRLTDILVCRTGQRVVNAAVAGLLPNLRYVFLTDGLLSSLDDEEIEAVFAHEAAHARLHHVAQRLLAVLLPLGIWQTVTSGVLADSIGPKDAVRLVDSSVLWGSSAVPAVAAGISMALVLAWFSRLLEYHADLWACSNLAWASIDPRATIHESVTTYTNTLEKIAHSCGPGGRRGGWLHPGLSSRIHFLQSVTRDPHRARAFRRRLRKAQAILLLAPPLVLVVLMGMG